jgi:hypothetical protein
MPLLMAAAADAGRLARLGWRAALLVPGVLMLVMAASTGALRRTARKATMTTCAPPA